MIALYRTVTFCLLALTLSQTTLAQQAASAGSVLKQLEPDTTVRPLPKTENQTAPEQKAQDTGPAIHVSSFTFEGNARISSATLQKVLSPYKSRDLTASDLKAATDAIAHAYQRKGWLARAIIPAQHIEHGIVKVQVLEGKFGKVVFDTQTSSDISTLNVSAERIAKRVQDRLSSGNALSVPNLTRGVLLAGDLPGINVAADEIAGNEPGLTDVALTVRNEEHLSGEFEVDNYGEASIGSERAIGLVNLNSIFGFGEDLGVLGVLTPDLEYGRFDLQVPLADNGLSLELDASGLDYTVVADRYKRAKPIGASNTAVATLQYPLLRALDHNIVIGFTALRRNFYNSNIAERLEDYHVYDALAFINGNLQDALLGGGVTTAGFTLERGWERMKGSPEVLLDEFGPDTQGKFNVLHYRLDRTQAIRGPLSAYVSFSGQLSYQNLDPSEQIYLGGPNGVEAYPVASNGGSSGQLLTSELRWLAFRAQKCQCGFKLLYNLGHIRLYANDEFPDSPQPDSYFLQAAGVGAYGSTIDNLSFSLTAVRKIGGSAGTEIQNAGLTGADQDTRVWANLAWRF